MVKKMFCLTVLLAVLIACGYESAWAQNHSYSKKPYYQTIQQYGPFGNSNVKKAQQVKNPCRPCLFYGGDFVDNPIGCPELPDGLANETTLYIYGYPYGAAVWVPFIIPDTVSWWDVTELFTNNFSIYGVLDEAPATPTSAVWYSINQFVSPGYPGEVYAQGISTGTSTPTGRGAFGLTEYTIAATGLDIPLAPGDYWMAVVPMCTNTADPYCGDLFYLSDVEYVNAAPTNASGPVEPIDLSYFDSPVFGYSFYPTNGPAGACFGAGCDQFSAGVVGTRQ